MKQGEKLRTLIILSFAAGLICGCIIGIFTPTGSYWLFLLPLVEVSFIFIALNMMQVPEKILDDYDKNSQHHNH